LGEIEMTESGLLGTERNYINSEMNYSHEEYNMIGQGLFHTFALGTDVYERKALLEWLEYNDAMYFERASNTGCQAQEVFWFQKYIDMPLDELKQTVSSIKKRE
jgi:hypothetical protein